VNGIGLQGCGTVPGLLGEKYHYYSTGKFTIKFNKRVIKIQCYEAEAQGHILPQKSNFSGSTPEVSCQTTSGHLCLVAYM
jgi:hypothetical protein